MRTLLKLLLALGLAFGVPFVVFFVVVTLQIPKPPGPLYDANGWRDPYVEEKQAERKDGGGSQWYVSQHGGGDCMTPAHPCTVSEVWDHVTPNSTINFEGGLYGEPLEVPEGIHHVTLEGNGAAFRSTTDRPAIKAAKGAEYITFRRFIAFSGLPPSCGGPQPRPEPTT